MAPGTPHASRNKIHSQAVRPHPMRPAGIIPRRGIKRSTVGMKRSGRKFKRNGRLAAALGGAVAGPVGAAGAYLAAKHLSQR